MLGSNSNGTNLQEAAPLHSTPRSQPNWWLWPAMVAQSDDWRTFEANPEVEPGSEPPKIWAMFGTVVVRLVPAWKCREGGTSVINDVRLKKKLLIHIVLKKRVSWNKYDQMDIFYNSFLNYFTQFSLSWKLDIFHMRNFIPTLHYAAIPM